MFEGGMDFTVTPAPPEGHRWLFELDGRLYSDAEEALPAQGSDYSSLVSSVRRFGEQMFGALNEKAQEQWRAPLEQQAGGLFLAAPSTQAKAAVAAAYHNGVGAGLEVLAKNSGLLRRAVRLLAAPPPAQGEHRPLLAAHPTSGEVAVAVREDVVRLSAAHDRLPTDFKTKHRVQALAWRPFSTHLAAASSAGLILWTANFQENRRTRKFAEQSMSVNRRRLLAAPNKAAVAALAWQPSGDYLAAAAGPEVYLVRPETEQWWPLPRGPPSHLLVWSPCGGRLLSASAGAAFHVWHAASWTADRWTVARGRLVAACFGPDGRLLIFADEAALYCLPPDGSAFLLQHGRVSGLAWNGRLLAALHLGSSAVHLYSTQTHPQLTITPHCLISGKEGETPCAIDFFPSAKKATVLLILWSSGRIQAFPFTNHEQFGSSDTN